MVAIILVVGVLLAWQSHHSCELRLGQTCFNVEYATTESQMERGLGGRDNLTPNQAMLFVLNQSSPACFWMKGMRFDLDIVWLDPDKRVTMIKPDLSPETYPQSYCPAQPAAYVLETKAGVMADKHILVGQQLNF